MAKFKMVVLTNAVDGRDAEFNSWYDDVHLPDVMDIPGIVGAERFRMREGSRWNYLAIYDVDCDNVTDVQNELDARAGTDRMTMTDALDMADIYMGIAETITPYRSA
ncbi:hypothetical protein OOT33_07930 [Sphingobium sp. DEHP117]|uniref:DUF4286 family protein n=1 Tax=Sphingobium sp. DEHP117 TaxID=2993436 RepID=UPI0027D6FD76|nr:DUF4286 family protein [Sphingobium sp. DEHP117]MDQ4420361.1 hypothetical protein [Sphingobium sp. DEHP117]